MCSCFVLKSWFLGVKVLGGCWALREKRGSCQERGGSWSNSSGEITQFLLTGSWIFGVKLRIECQWDLTSLYLEESQIFILKSALSKLGWYLSCRMAEEKYEFGISGAHPSMK